MVNESFKIDIFDKTNNSHIRITESNILFKYQHVIKYYYIFPKLFSNISLKGKLWETPTYAITKKVNLSPNGVNYIIEKINTLNNNSDNEIIVRYNGNIKYTNSIEINNIFENYNIKI